MLLPSFLNFVIMMYVTLDKDNNVLKIVVVLMLIIMSNDSSVTRMLLLMFLVLKDFMHILVNSSNN